MADGAHNFNPNDSTKSPGPEKTPDASAKLFEASVSKPAETAKVGDPATQQFNPGDAKGSTDSKGYQPGMLDGASDSLKQRFEDPKEGLNQTAANIASKLDTLKDTEYQGSAEAWVNHYTAANPAMAEVVKR